jgi:uncharacterized membrane protein
MMRAAGAAWWALVVVGVFGYLLSAGIALWGDPGPVRSGSAAICGAIHACAYVCLLFVFGRTLARGREAFITRIARQVHGALPPELEAYTRRLTLTWCVFFAAQLAASALLLGFGSTNAWSVFINVLNFPLVALMFAGDWIYRAVRYPHTPGASIATAVQAYAKDRASSLRAR